jgi:hypothetical protein
MFLSCVRGCLTIYFSDSLNDDKPPDIEQRSQSNMAKIQKVLISDIFSKHGNCKNDKNFLTHTSNTQDPNQQL